MPLMADSIYAAVDRAEVKLADALRVARNQAEREAAEAAYMAVFEAAVVAEAAIRQDRVQ